MSSKKYKLFSAAASGGDGPRPCAFFASEAGCKNGDACKFSHAAVTPTTSTKIGADAAAAAAAAPASATKAAVATPPSDVASVVSSESEGEIAPPAEVNATAESGKKKKKDRAKKKDGNKKRKDNPNAAADSFSDSPFANPKAKKSTPKQQQQQQQKKQKQKQQNVASPVPVGTYAAMAQNNSAAQSPFQPPQQQQNAQQQQRKPPAGNSQQQGQQQQPPKKKAKRESSTPQTPKARAAAAAAANNDTPMPSFRDLDLPLAPFTIPDVPDKQPPSPSPSDDDDPPQHRPAPSDDGTTLHPHRPLPLPKSTPEGRKWQNAVIATRSHPRYDATYDFETYKESDLAQHAESWIKAKPHSASSTGAAASNNNPAVIAIDCEMCETRDPVSGTSDPKALCRISIVDATNLNSDGQPDVLLDTLVKPTWPVVDYRSRINGIRKEHLEGVQFTLRHAQAFLLALCTDETVLVGHALHNDLVALRMEHDCVVDSAFLYEVKDEPDATPSLRDMAMSVLAKPMPDTHDSVNDARTALLCLESYVEKGGKVDPIVRSYPRRKNGGGGGGGNSLLVHRIPKGCFPDHLRQMFLAHTSVQPNEVGPIEFGSSTGKVNVTFSSHDHARLAFDTLAGEERPDKTGRGQKKVYLRNGDYVQVRRMTKSRQAQAQAQAQAVKN